MLKWKKNEKTTLTPCQPPILLMLLVCTKMLSTQGVKQLEIKSQKLRVQKLEHDIPTQTESGKPGKKKVVCGNCHQKTTHEEPTCPNESCETLRQCGSHKNHPEESKFIGTAKADLARLIRESETLEAKISHQEAALDGITNSFAAKIKKP